LSLSINQIDVEASRYDEIKADIFRRGVLLSDSVRAHDSGIGREREGSD